MSSTWAHVNHVCARRCWFLQLASQRASRQQVSEPIGSGRSSCCEQSRREAPGTAKAARSLTRDSSAGSLDGAAGERAQARDPEATRATTRYDAQTKAAVAVGVLFRQDLDHGGEESSSNAAPECARSDQRAREGARGVQSRLRRFERSCSWIVLIAEVDERRLAFHRTVTGLASPPQGAEGRTGVGSRNATAKS